MRPAGGLLLGSATILWQSGTTPFDGPVQMEPMGLMEKSGHVVCRGVVARECNYPLTVRDSLI